jgi:hypothetical protein
MPRSICVSIATRLLCSTIGNLHLAAGSLLFKCVYALSAIFGWLNNMLLLSLLTIMSIQLQTASLNTFDEPGVEAYISLQNRKIRIALFLCVVAVFISLVAVFTVDESWVQAFIFVAPVLLVLFLLTSIIVHLMDLRKKVNETDSFVDNLKWKLAFTKTYFVIAIILMVLCVQVGFAFVYAFSKGSYFPKSIDAQFQVSIFVFLLGILLSKVTVTFLGLWKFGLFRLEHARALCRSLGNQRRRPRHSRKHHICSTAAPARILVTSKT